MEKETGQVVQLDRVGSVCNRESFAHKITACTNRSIGHAFGPKHKTFGFPISGFKLMRNSVSGEHYPNAALGR